MIADGIYVNLPMQAYRDDPALGSSDLKKILANAVQWHAKFRNTSWRELNPPSDAETAATKFGTALHVMALEPDAFDDRYYMMPEEPDLPSTKEDINACLRAIGRQPLKSSDKSAVYAAEARMHGIMTLADWRADQALIAGERERISDAWDRSLRLLRKMLDGHAEAMKFLRNGRAEVSVFWTDDNGVRFKCRFDYLRIRTAADVKSYALQEDNEPIQNFAGAVEKWGYDFSAAHYMDCRLNVIPALVEAEAVFDAGDVMPADWSDGACWLAGADNREFFQKVAAEPSPSWWWIACMTQGFPEVDTCKFGTDLMQFQVAASQVDLAKATYIEYRDKFGDDGAATWISQRGLIVLTDHNFMSNRARDRGAVKWEAG